MPSQHLSPRPSSQPGGYFVNLGPLLYHWADAHTYLEGEELSVELSLEEVKAAAAQVGAGLGAGQGQLRPNVKLLLGSALCPCQLWSMSAVQMVQLGNAATALLFVAICRPATVPCRLASSWCETKWCPPPSCATSGQCRGVACWCCQYRLAALPQESGSLSCMLCAPSQLPSPAPARRSMMQSSTYNCAFWTMQKVDRAAAATMAAGAAADQPAAK